MQEKITQISLSVAKKIQKTARQKKQEKMVCKY